MANFQPKKDDFPKLQLPKFVRRVVMSEVDAITPPNLSKISAVSTISGIENNGPHETVFPAKLNVERVFIPTETKEVEFLLFTCHSENGYSLKTIIPVKNFSDRDLDILKGQISKRELTVLYHDQEYTVAALEHPIKMQAAKIDRKLFEVDIKGKEFVIRTFAKRPGEEHSIFTGYVSLVGHRPDNISQKTVITYLDPKTINSFGHCGTFEKMPYLPFYHPGLAQANFPEESYVIIGENGKEQTVKFNCLSNMNMHIPLIKPTEEQITSKDLPLEEVACLRTIPNKLWRRYLDTVFKHQYIESVESLVLGSPEGDEPDVGGRAKTRHSESNEQLGEIYDGPRKSLKVKGEFVLFEVSLTSGKNLFIVDSPLYGRALHAFNDSASAEKFIQNYGYNRNGVQNEAFCIYHTGDWKSRLVKHIDRLNS